ncbi:EutP/PduV family microcompartment system protein [Clostridium algidicarnis]|uniref:EutP/PduV family microcompartment system protein n=1 Tax=Clostridium algidicarnis TaxID=37659 RepID=UPI001C0C96F1|nr:EutP/PduV family microcompartment system protein [Clostridium algidicarnis]MBU3209980.1 EutP/PduV family microcompartment system protein [Clostridium algidicarnis]MBU3228520.1 EutP/PduV family microcompartment system protein [Clostridium algidicarnis]MBU3252263.1 EutP/PduV family microcompartment system protein [Clostridium algidicarnis]
MKKIMLIGSIGAGKTTLSQALIGEIIRYKKTQSIEFGDYIIDTPGEYLDNRVYYNALIVTSAEADVIALVQDSSNDTSNFPPGFGSMFNKEVIGICTKIDLCKDEKSLKRTEEFLITAGAEKIFCVNAAEKKEIEELKRFLECN